MRHEEVGPAVVSFREAFRFWLKLGFINFGGPTGQIAIMHDELVSRRRWISEDRFLHALSFCMLLPGPEAQQLATYVGWLLHGVRGGIVAGTLFFLPAATLMLGLAYVYALHGQLSLVEGVFDGLSAAVIGVVAAAGINLARRTLRSVPAAATAAVSFLMIFLVGVPLPVVILAAAALGAIVGPGALGSYDLGLPAGASSARPPSRSVLVTLVTGLAVWWVPLLAALAVLPDAVPSREGVFFSQVAVVSFGGAYAVLAYVSREVVTRFGLSAADVVAGLGLAETTPGPLILVVEFLGFVAAYRDPGSLSPVVAGLLGASITVWATFAPSFLWIFLGAPWIERLRSHAGLRGALASITASVVGVIAALAVTLAAHVLFGSVDQVRPLWTSVPVPDPTSLDPFTSVVAAVALIAMWRFEVNVLWIVASAALAGLANAFVR